MASKCKFLYILTVRLRARKPTIKIVGFLARKFYKKRSKLYPIKSLERFILFFKLLLLLGKRILAFYRDLYVRNVRHHRF